MNEVPNLDQLHLKENIIIQSLLKGGRTFYDAAAGARKIIIEVDDFYILKVQIKFAMIEVVQSIQPIFKRHNLKDKFLKFYHRQKIFI